MIELVLGGARSGKSRYAEQQAKLSGKQVLYVATAEAKDQEMTARIKRHQQQRPADWQTIEEPIQLAQVLQQNNHSQICLLVDCLTLWLTNILFDPNGQIRQTVFDTERQALFDQLGCFSGQLIMVSNEVGSGIIAMDAMTRRFVDEVGFLHQQLAQLSDQVVLVTAGLPQILKSKVISESNTGYQN